MIEIGEKLKEARESIGITVEEVSEDLKVRPSQVEEVEKGNIKALKDVAKEPNNNNADLLRRVSNLEKFIYGDK